jgi:hypothetical protein
MLKLTKAATAHLLRVRTERGFGPSAGARLVRGSTGIGLTFARAPQEGDKVLRGSDFPVYVAEDVAEILDRGYQRDHHRGPGMAARHPPTARQGDAGSRGGATSSSLAPRRLMRRSLMLHLLGGPTDEATRCRC